VINPVKDCVTTVDAFSSNLANHRAAGKKIVFTNGCFDIVHPGHMKVFAEARAQGDCLIVGLNSDRSIGCIKDPRRPIMNQTERAGVLSAVRYIDYIIMFDEETPKALIEAITPDVLVKGGDWGLDNIVGADHVKKNGGRVHVVSLKEGSSTTNIIDRVLTKYAPGITQKQE